MKRTSFTLFQEVQNVVLLSVNFLSPILFNSDLPNPGKYQSYAVPTDLEEISRVVNSVSDPVFSRMRIRLLFLSPDPDRPKIRSDPEKSGSVKIRISKKVLKLG